MYHAEQLTSGREKPKAEPKTMPRRPNQPRPYLTFLGRRSNGSETTGPQTAETGLLMTELGIKRKAMILGKRERNGQLSAPTTVHTRVGKTFCPTHRMKVQAQNVCTILEETAGVGRASDVGTRNVALGLKHKPSVTGRWQHDR